ncbi:hypothetical protein ACJX0J_038127, partial [Zea mays]
SSLSFDIEIVLTQKNFYMLLLLFVGHHLGLKIINGFNKAHRSWFLQKLFICKVIIENF